MKWMLLALTAAFCAPQMASAGAWARGKGKTFVSATAILTWPKGRALEYPDVYGGLYIERGLGPRLTFGLDIGTSDATRPSRLKAMGFMRYTLTAPDARLQFALDIGAGRYLNAPALRLGAALSSGVSLGSKQGWISLDAHALHQIGTSKTAITLDATFGVSMERSKLMAQLSGFRSLDGRRSAQITPSYVRQIGKGRFFEIGASIDLKSTPDPVLKIGVWQEF